MAEFVSAMMGSNLPTDTSSTGIHSQGQLQDKTSLSEATEVTGFPQLFASIDPVSATAEETMLADAFNPFAPLALVVGAPSAMPTDPTLMGQSGNVLPQNLPAMHVTGYLAQADQDSAAAISFAGDNKHLISTNPQLAKEIGPAIAQAQLKLHAGLQQQMQNPLLDLQNLYNTGKLRIDDAKQLELLTEMARQSDSFNESLSSKPITSSALSQILSGPMTMQEASTSLAATSRALQPMTANLQQPHWNEQIGERLNVMISRGLQRAEIRLNPPELGMLEVKDQIQGEQANVHFNTAHGQVKEALDAAMPRLREMLEQNGLTLGDVNVSHQSLANGQSQPGEETGSHALSQSGNPDDEQLHDAEGMKDATINKEIGLLDVFA